MEISTIPKVFENRIRLAIITALISGEKTFKELKVLINATDGNLGAQLLNLESNEYISVHKEFVNRKPQTSYKITKKGMNASDLYTPNIPVYIKEPIDNSINELFNTEKVRNSVRSKITRIRKNEYSVECELYDDDDTNLLKLSLYAGSREEAERMAVYFKNEPNIVYETILTAFNEELHHISED